MEELTLEEGLERLGVLTERLEKEKLPLEEMFALYEEGVKLAKLCGLKIDTVEKKMKVLTADGRLPCEED